MAARFYTPPKTQPAFYFKCSELKLPGSEAVRFLPFSAKFQNVLSYDVTPHMFLRGSCVIKHMESFIFTLPARLYWPVVSN